MNEQTIVARPLITITNLIFSFDPATKRVQVLLIKRSQAPFLDRWALPETNLRAQESADQAAVRLVKEKIGPALPTSATEQLATFTSPHRAPGERALALAYMTFLPAVPTLAPGYGATAAAWFRLTSDGAGTINLDHGQQHFLIGKGTAAPALAFDHDQILGTAVTRIKNKLDYQPSILQVLGPSFTLRQAREVFAPFMGKAADQIDNSNFRKTHQHLLTEVGTSTVGGHSGRPPKIYRLRHL